MTPLQMFEELSAAANTLDIEAKRTRETAVQLSDRADALAAKAAALRQTAYQFDPDAKEEARQRMCTGKRAYKTPKAAGDAANDISKRRQVELRIYECPFCQQFHFTSISLEAFSAAA